MLKIIERIGRAGAKCQCNRCSNIFITKDLYSSKKSVIGCLCNKCKTVIMDIQLLDKKTIRKWFNYDYTTGNFTHKFTTLSGDAGKDATAIHSSGYRTIRIGGKDYLVHRVIFIYMENYLPIQVDHINHNRSDNKWNNLREVTNRENHLNESIASNNTSGILGVALHKATNKYRAYIMIHKKQIHLGLYNSIEEAKLSREKANTKYGFYKNHGK